jgi:hypothetical protein
MNSKILLTTFLITVSFIASAQHNSRSYAITGKENNNFFWTDIKEVDIATGKVIKTLFEADKTPFKMTNSDDNPTTAGKNASINPTGIGVAACALDAVHNRLYFSPMHFSDIRYLELNRTDASFTTIKTKIVPTSSGEALQPEENQITRMVIAADGYGYALTNDANHLIRFSTGKKAVVEDLGVVIDATENKGISIHNKCTSWGGDMVADAYGKLYIVAASHNVFTIDVATKIATLKGTITGLPADFTTNGAAVDNDGNVVVSSANVFVGLYKLNISTLVAEKVQTSEKAFNASDLANGNFLLQKEADEARKFEPSKFPQPLTTASDAKIFPNPATGSEFRILFEGQKAGRYTIMLTDLAGSPIQSKVVNLSKNGQTQNFRLARNHAKGIYIVKVMGEDKQVTFTEKLVIE